MNTSVILENNISILKLVSSLKTDVASIRKNYVTEQPLVSRLETNTVFILENNVTELKLASSLETDVASICKNNVPKTHWYFVLRRMRHLFLRIM